MLQITIPGFEYYDEKNGMIVTVKGQDLQLEHSLVSISKWESKWKKPFLGTEGKTRAETIDYIRCMTLTQNVKPNVYQGITYENIQQVNDYISDPMTATTFRSNTRKGASNSVITSEIIYYWMISLEIPMECQRWHLNRLLTLVRVCDEKSQPGKKMSKHDVMSQYRSLNAARRSRYGTRG